MMFLAASAGLLLTAVLAFRICLASRELDWRPIFIVVVGNSLISATAFIVQFAWPARRVIFSGNASIFHGDILSLVTILIAFLLLFSMVEVLLLWIVVCLFRHVKPSATRAFPRC